MRTGGQSPAGLAISSVEDMSNDQQLGPDSALVAVIRLDPRQARTDLTLRACRATTRLQTSSLPTVWWTPC